MRASNSMTDAPRYEMTYIRDLCQVPKDRRAAMLADLVGWLAVQDQLSGVTMAQDGFQMGGRFVWIDDGIVGLSEIEFTPVDCDHGSADE